MPELPEVYTIVSDLKKTILKNIIASVEISQNYNVKPDNTQFKSRVLNNRVKDVKRIAKNILIELESGDTIAIHLAMTGRVLLFEKGVPKTVPWEKVRIKIVDEDQKKNKILSFSDMRMFGKVVLIKPGDITLLQEKYGPEPISDSLNVNEFIQRLKTKKTTIKNLLLDQSAISGLGNIYATDALFLAQIHPETSTHEITEGMAKKLLESAKLILEEGIAHRGSTLPDKMYVDIFGKAGSHQDHFRIYMKQQCPTCNSRVSFKKINGRGTYYCDQCQLKSPQKTLF